VCRGVGYSVGPIPVCHRLLGFSSARARGGGPGPGFFPVDVTFAVVSLAIVCGLSEGCALRCSKCEGHWAVHIFCPLQVYFFYFSFVGGLSFGARRGARGVPLPRGVFFGGWGGG